MFESARNLSGFTLAMRWRAPHPELHGEPRTSSELGEEWAPKIKQRLTAEKLGGRSGNDI